MSNTYVDFSAFDAAAENLDSSLTTDAIMSLETCSEALLFEALKRISNFNPRPDVEQDLIEIELATKLLGVDQPFQAIMNNIIRCVNGIKADVNQAESNGEECGVVDAPKGSQADEWRDQLESIIRFVRSLARQVVRAGYYRYNGADRALSRAGVVPFKDEAGVFTGRYEGTDYASLSDSNYDGWTKVRVAPDTIITATEELTATCTEIWNKCSGLTSQWFQVNQKFNLGGFKVGTGANDYQNFISVSDAWAHFQKETENRRPRKDAYLVTRDFVV